MKKINKKINILLIVLIISAVIIDCFKFNYTQNISQNRLISKIIVNSIGIIISIIFLKKFEIHLFQKPEKIVFFIPCLIVAVNNMQWSSLLNNKMTLVNHSAFDFILFSLNCFTTAFFEELIFRGILFSTLIFALPSNKKSFLLSFVLTSIIFGISHFINGFSAFLQVGYSILTGGLFLFCFIKTKNIMFSVLTHGIYNFCGLLFDKNGLGSGVVFDLGTTISMLLVGTIVGLFVVYKTINYSEQERICLYEKLNIQ